MVNGTSLQIYTRNLQGITFISPQTHSLITCENWKLKGDVKQSVDENLSNMTEMSFSNKFWSKKINQSQLVIFFETK